MSSLKTPPRANAAALPVLLFGAACRRGSPVDVSQKRMNLVLEHSKFVEYYTYLDPIFDAAPELVEFTYLISDVQIADARDERLAQGPIVIRGQDLRAIIQEKKVQFIWAVLSAFDYIPAIPSELPYADGNTGFWSGHPRPQLPEARFEIVCWDSSATLFIGVEAFTAANLQKQFPDIRDLDDYNRQGANQLSQPTPVDRRG